METHKYLIMIGNIYRRMDVKRYVMKLVLEDTVYTFLVTFCLCKVQIATQFGNFKCYFLCVTILSASCYLIWQIMLQKLTMIN